MSESTKQSINEPINQLTDQPSRQASKQAGQTWINQLINQTVSQWVKQVVAAIQPVNQTVNQQSINRLLLNQIIKQSYIAVQPIIRTVKKSVNQAINQPVNSTDTQNSITRKSRISLHSQTTIAHTSVRACRVLSQMFVRPDPFADARMHVCSWKVAVVSCKGAWNCVIMTLQRACSERTSASMMRTHIMPLSHSRYTYKCMHRPMITHG